ncbi:hypothetical protein I0C86_41375 [Plantactinospora sp. S1510]|uniref:Uncharacterized protein n=1 Tax=Plantactinospora alkalitolerans TaxID=2789879 RepID=A0ABS0H9Z5_9ACTN|nr:hypothetical protein [Plantactinospora alkalitolerans]MBF9135304.1 hypothetical protein [Plantactinospora alkalitolerans]
MSELDQPESDRHECVLPFIVCRSANGPYEDDSFTAGFSCGAIDAELAALAAVGGVQSRTYSVLPEVLPQLDLIGMRHRYPIMEAVVPEEHPDWAFVTFRRSDDD